MTFHELRLMVAVHKINCGARDYPTHSGRFKFALAVQRQYCLDGNDTWFPFGLDEVMSVYMKYRKSADAKIKADIAIAHGIKCFWERRGKGPCDDTAEAGHLWQNCKDGPYSVENCIIECRAHNNQRSALTIEEYIKSDKTAGVS